MSHNANVEIIDYARYMDFALGSAFELVWHIEPTFRDESMELVHSYIQDALTYRPVSIDEKAKDIMMRKFNYAKGENEFDQEQINYCTAIITASAGNYTTLNALHENYLKKCQEKEAADD